jgi:hypothetical protein
MGIRNEVPEKIPRGMHKGKRIKEFERRERDGEDVGASKERTRSKRNPQEERKKKCSKKLSEGRKECKTYEKNEEL